MLLHVAAEWQSSVVTPSLQHVNAPTGKIHSAILKLSNFNKKQCRCVFHYDGLAMLSKFQVSSWFWQRTKMNWKQWAGKKNREMYVSSVICKHTGFTGLHVQNHWYGPLSFFIPLCVAACSRCLTDSRAGTGLQGLVTVINKNPEHRTHLHTVATICDFKTTSAEAITAPRWRMDWMRRGEKGAERSM